MSRNTTPIYVTQPVLPPLEDFTKTLERIWESKILTNNGPLHQELEAKLCAYLGVPYISLFNNCTIGLMAAFPVLGLTGEVITTPFTFIATAHSLIWANLKPVFVDIDPQTLTIDPTKIEAAITPDTSAILAVHCYGRPCDAPAIQDIADRHHLKVIYDAAHIFGVEDDHGRVGQYGDLAVLSFHATKVFNTFEGGAIICHDKETKDRIDRFKNFGIVSENHIESIGLNGKLSEIHAAMGLHQLTMIDDLILRRKAVYDRYHETLADIKGLTLPDYADIKRPNYSYFPIMVADDFGLSRDELCQAMNADQIFPRKYFYPSITDLQPYQHLKTHCPVADDMASRVLCLPIYPMMAEDDITRVIDSIRSACKV